MMDDFFIFDGIKSTDKNITLIDYKRIFLPANNRSFLQIPGKDGSVPKGEDTKQDIILDCEVSITGDDEREINNNIENTNVWLSKRGELTFWDMLDRYYIGEVIGEISMDSQIKWNLFSLQFRCNPIKYGEAKSFDITQSPTIYNTGTYHTKGIITIEITEEVDHIEVTLQNTGEFIYLEDSFVSGDKVVIDLEKEYISKNGYSAMQNLYLESDFFRIPVGEFRITTNTGNTTLEYIERWL